MIMVTGGSDSSGTYLASSEVYQFPAGDVWQAAADLPSPRLAPRGASLTNRLYVLGGYGDDFLDDVLIYDVSTDTFSLAGHLTTDRYRHAGTEVPWQAVAQYCSTTADQTSVPTL